jgi:hypothetical protein
VLKMEMRANDDLRRHCDRGAHYRSALSSAEEGAQGPPGPPGPSHAYSASSQGGVTFQANTTGTLLSVAVPSGSYVVSAKVVPNASGP